MFASLWNNFSSCWTCSLRFENNFLTIEGVRFASISTFSLWQVEQAEVSGTFSYYRICSLHFDIEENTIIEVYVCFSFSYRCHYYYYSKCLFPILAIYSTDFRGKLRSAYEMVNYRQFIVQQFERESHSSVTNMQNNKKTWYIYVVYLQQKPPPHPPWWA